MDNEVVPFWFRIVYALYLAVLVPVYSVQYPLANFLWFSDIALVVTCVAAWVGNSLLASMMALAVLAPEIVWNLGFFTRLIFGVNPFGLADYMFNPQKPLYVRALSLFHVPLPVAIVYLISRLGYDRRALLAQTIVSLVVLP
ncbi:MAG TPA: hypothetical protein VMD30_02525, partial [Tepidisphaeraceae bacterium]|nr:hypothetical protein [Tepidisphaeraceae bacterium]